MNFRLGRENGLHRDALRDINQLQQHVKQNGKGQKPALLQRQKREKREKKGIEQLVNQRSRWLRPLLERYIFTLHNR